MPNSEWFHGKWQTDSVSHKNANTFFYGIFFSSFASIRSYCADNNKLEIGTVQYIVRWPDRIAVLTKRDFTRRRSSHSCNQVWPAMSSISRGKHTKWSGERVRCEEDEKVVYFSGANYEGLWSELMLDLSQASLPLSLNNKKLKLIMPSGARQCKGNWEVGETRW